MFGKWHLGHEGAYRPECRGFDESLTTVADSQWSHFDPVLLRNGVEEQHCGYRTDILPTLAELAGAELTAGQAENLDGISLVPQLTEHAQLPERMIFTHQGRWPTGEAAWHKYAQCSVRWKQYDLVRNDVCDDPVCKGECRINHAQ